MPAVEMTRVSPNDAARHFGVNYYTRAYEQGITVSQLLEQDDPTSDYPEGERELDAFERVMEAAELLTSPQPQSGVRASTWQEASATKEKRALLHEFCARVWRQFTNRVAMTPTTRALLTSGETPVNTLANQFTDDMTIRAKRLVAPIPLDALLARSTPIEGQDYRSLYIVDDLNADAYRMKRVMEGAEIPATTLVSGEHTMQIHKFGRLLRATYEQLRRQRLDRIAFIISRMALQAEVDKGAIVLDTVVNGDGNANTSSTVVALTALDAAATAGTLTLKGWLNFKRSFTSAYMLDVILAQGAAISQLELLPVNTVNGIPLILLTQNQFGSLRNIGASNFNGAIGYGEMTDAPALKLVGFDSNQTVEEVTEIGGQVSEVERFTNNQTQTLSMTEVVGYGIIDANGSKTLNING